MTSHLAADLAQEHWNETPLFLSAEDRYRIYPWLPKAAEFTKHSGERVLEIGCGTGCDLLQFARNGATATGVDITDKHLELARQRVGDLAELSKADARQLPFEDASFDYVYSHGVIHHSDQPELIVNELLRVLKPGGCFNVQVYSLLSAATLEYVVRFGTAWRRHVENSQAPVHIEMYTKRKLRNVFAPIELEITKYACRVPILQRWFGAFLVATGTKPE